jgi:hypothetical protein
MEKRPKLFQAGRFFVNQGNLMIITGYFSIFCFQVRPPQSQRARISLFCAIVNKL